MRLAATTLMVCVSALVALGMVMLYSAAMTQHGAQLLRMQLIWGCVGLLACVTVAWMDYRWIQRAALPLFAVAVILLALVLIPGVGTRINGARRWFDVGFAFLQPSELCKFALVVMLAWYSARNSRRMQEIGRGLVVPGMIVALVSGLVFVEPDRGCTLLLVAVAGVILVIAGVRWLYLLPPAAAFLALFATVLWIDPVRKARILAFLHPEQYKDGVGYQTMQGLLAFDSGGWFGRGLGSSRQKLGFIPFHYTDSIFPIVGEELGLIATLLVVLAFSLILVCGISIALRARDNFGRLLGAGVTFLIAFQALINLGVVTSVLPNKGMPLPFISYGGSNLLLMLTCVGVLLSIARHSVAAGVAVLRPLENDSLPLPQPQAS